MRKYYFSERVTSERGKQKLRRDAPIHIKKAFQRNQNCHLLRPAKVFFTFYGSLRFEKSHNLLISPLTLRALATRTFELLQLDRRATANSPSRRSNTFSLRSMQGRPVFEQDDEASIDPILLSCTLLANLVVKYEL